MNQRTLEVLEYNRIVDLLKSQTGSELSGELAEKLAPLDDIRIISEELRSTTEAVDLIVHKGALPTGGISDIRDIAGYAVKGGSLTMRQLITVRYDLVAAERVKSFVREDVPEIPKIMEMVRLLETGTDLAKDIERAIISEDEMSDAASSALASIRRDINKQNEVIRSRLTQMVNSSSNRPYLQDSIVTIRDGRYVIPVKQEHRGKFPGVVHDQSNAGSTLFVEPQVIVDMNNRLRELEAEEQREIARILKEFSERVAERSDALINNQNLLVKLDFIMAKGKLSCVMNGEMPKMSEGGELRLINARHPLLDAEKVVPVSVTIGGDIRTLVVTGPNTGGKTVTLKTCGLLSLMAMSGLHIPASSESCIPLFREIFADIGDEQSIEQSLSTFSSHMKNIVNIVAEAGPGSLVLLDELGAGTDPTEGAALAISVLRRLQRSGALVLATTHYNELKKYALSEEGAVNASMEFDVDTLSPTYRLIVGTPGSSNAFEISKKLGLDPDIIEGAKGLIEVGDMEFENVISEIEQDRKRAEDAKAESERLLSEAKRKEQEATEKLKDIEERRDRYLEKARAEAREVVREAKETAKEVKKELRNLAGIDSLGQRNKALRESEGRLKAEEERYSEKIVRKVNSNPVKAADLKLGERVKVLSLDQNGELISLPDDRNEVMVQLGIMKVSVPLEDIMIIVDGRKPSKPKRPSRESGIRMRKSMTASMEKNVQGMNLEEAVMEVGKYLDDAFLAGLRTVTVIHGRGEGILRDGIRKSLSRNKHVASFRPGNYNEGGDGVTIVTLKE